MKTISAKVGRHIVTDTTLSDLTSVAYGLYPAMSNVKTGQNIKFKYMILEGDYTQNPPSYFEGLKSVGDDLDALSLTSRKEDGNLNSNKSYIKGTLDNNSHVSTNRGIYGELYIEVSPNTTYRVTAITSATIETYKTMLCNASKNFIKVEWERTFTTPSNCRYVRVGVMTTTDVTSDQANSFKMQLEEGTDNTTYKECIQNKKQILYQTKEGNYEKPILRSTGTVSDSIEKHSDGKYYFHKRCGEVVLNGSANEGFVLNNSMSAHKEVSLKFETQKFKDIVKPIYDKEISNHILCDTFRTSTDSANHSNPEECITQTVDPFNSISIRISKSRLSTPDADGLAKWLQSNNTTVVVALAKEEIYECVNLDLDSYEGETSIICNSIIPPSNMSFKIANHISNTVEVMKDRISDTETKIAEMLNADMVQSLGATGYKILPGGLILQWGTATLSSGKAYTTITFPIKFPNACLNVSLTKQYSSDYNPINAFPTSSKAQGWFNINHPVSTNSKIEWFAIGY